MKKEEFEQIDGIDRLRRAVNYFNACYESFNQKFSAEDLLKIYEAGMLCEWDVYPDGWTKQQVEAAIKGTVPKFEESKCYSPTGLHALDVKDCYCRDCKDKREEEERRREELEDMEAV